MKGTRRRSHKQRLRFNQWGFTLIEVLIIIMVIGILAAVAAPSFGSLADSIKVNQTVTELRSSLQESQRQSIRANKVCETQVKKGKDNSGHGNNENGKKSNQVQGNCLTSGDRTLPDGVDMSTNIQSIAVSSVLPATPETTTIRFVPSGSAEFKVLTVVPLPSLPNDPTGKIVAYISSNQKVQKKCIAISSTLGLTRIGTYTGDINPTSITDSGVCTASDWRQQ